MRRILVLCLIPILSACVVKDIAETAVDVVKAPVKVAGATVDATTTSQAEADQKRGKALRKAEEAHGNAMRKWADECAKAESRGEPCPQKPEYIPPED